MSNASARTANAGHRVASTFTVREFGAAFPFPFAVEWELQWEALNAVDADDADDWKKERKAVDGTAEFARSWNESAQNPARAPVHARGLDANAHGVPTAPQPNVQDTHMSTRINSRVRGGAAVCGGVREGRERREKGTAREGGREGRRGRGADDEQRMRESACGGTAVCGGVREGGERRENGREGDGDGAGAAQMKSSAGLAVQCAAHAPPPSASLRRRQRVPSRINSTARAGAACGGEGEGEDEGDGDEGEDEGDGDEGRHARSVHPRAPAPRVPAPTAPPPPNSRPKDNIQTEGEGAGVGVGVGVGGGSRNALQRRHVVKVRCSRIRIAGIRGSRSRFSSRWGCRRKGKTEENGTQRQRKKEEKQRGEIKSSNPTHAHPHPAPLSLPAPSPHQVQFRAPPPPPSATRPEPLVSDPSSPSSTRNTRTPNRPPFRNSSYLSTEVRLGFTEHRRAAKVGWIDSGGMSWRPWMDVEWPR
ncbi:hypothetical protein C8F04DRAFT_1323582 [Mycena alexandri]|uniref:Uncharacterized protein n=1 Tax=Mycena alexandri TaxID=1745969 RepID=A0AAD6TMF0_9AGAR|nr:hypothetical protein C8F04DRAFT_1323582 [Mycena alexandri]